MMRTILRNINKSGVPHSYCRSKPRAALILLHRGCVMETGKITLEDYAPPLLSNVHACKAYLGG